MEKEFTPYEEALALKELGFDEPCFGNYYKYLEHEFNDPRSSTTFTFNEDNPIRLSTSFEHKDHALFLCAAPLYQQAFRWFREKHNLHSSFTRYRKSIVALHPAIYPSLYEVDIIDDKNNRNITVGEFNIYEEAELACLRKLIEIVKNK
jgi:hypothetical protein